MRKFLFFLIVMLFPLFTYAATFNDSKNIANNYYTKFNTFDRYLRFSTKYDVDTSFRPKENTNFKTGGLLSKQEFDITMKGFATPSFSYLFDGISFWTLSASGENRYVISDNPEYEDKNLKHNTKVTEFVKKTTKVRGSGAFDNPWIFVEKFRVEVASNGHGGVSVKNTSRKIANSEGREIEEVEEGNDSVFSLSPDIGYVYQGNTCGANVIVENNILTIKNVSANMNCTVTFKENEYVINFPRPYQDVTTNLLGKTRREFADAIPNQFYYQYNVGYFRDEEKKNRLTTLIPPYRRGWTFVGYYVNEKTETNRLLNGYNYEDRRNNPNLMTNLSTNYKFFKEAKWKQNASENIEFTVYPNEYTVYFNSDDGTNPDPTSKKVIFEHDIPEIKTIPRKAGYIFEGYYTDTKGRKGSNAYIEKYYAAITEDLFASANYNRKVVGARPLEVWQEDKDTILYANYSACHVGHYCVGDNTERECQVGTYQDQTGQTSCKPCPAGTYQDETGKSSCKDCTPGQYQDDTGQTSCKCCTPGHYQSSYGKTSCTICQAGTYQGSSCASSCSSCPAGQTCPAGSTSQSSCYTPSPPPSDDDGGGGGGCGSDCCSCGTCGGSQCYANTPPMSSGDDWGCGNNDC